MEGIIVFLVLLSPMFLAIIISIDESKVRSLLKRADAGDETAKKILQGMEEYLRSGDSKELKKHNKKFNKIKIKFYEPKALEPASEATAFAQYRLGCVYKNMKNQQKAAADWLRKAANNGNVDAMKILAHECYTGKKGEILFAETWEQRDKINNIFWMGQAVEAGDAEEMKKMGDLYYFGKNGVEVNKDEARNFYERAASAGYFYAFGNLAGFCEEETETLELLLKQLDIATREQRDVSGAWFELGMFFKYADWFKNNRMVTAYCYFMRLSSEGFSLYEENLVELNYCIDNAEFQKWSEEAKNHSYDISMFQYGN